MNSPPDATEQLAGPPGVTPVGPGGLTGPAALAALAARHGLSPNGARPPLTTYLVQLTGRRHFVAALANARLTAQYGGTVLGGLWLVLTPLLNAAVSYLVFGVLMNTRDGVEDYVPFLVTGVFVFAFTQSCATGGIRAISGNLGLIRALHFPRAALPLAVCLQQLRQLLFSLGALAVVLLLCGVAPAVSWLLAVPALALQTLFNAGLTLGLARLGSRIPDAAQLLPFLTRTWMYVSGVMWSIRHAVASGELPWLAQRLLELNPAALYLDLVRHALLGPGSASGAPGTWLFAALWAVVTASAGFLWFLRGEETYGRD